MNSEYQTPPSRPSSMGWGPESHQRVSQTSFEKQLDPRGPIASQEGSVLEFLRKPIANYDFPGGGGPCPPLWIHPWFRPNISPTLIVQAYLTLCNKNQIHILARSTMVEC